MRQPLPASRKAANTSEPASKAGRRGLARQPPGPAQVGSLPAPLRQGIEALSGFDLGGVRVHHGSPMPAALGAQAYAQGHDIHLAPGQDHHLPHEAWHVVQQAQGRVAPTMQMAGGWAVNQDRQLEQEADAMGARAAAWPAAAAGPSASLAARLPAALPAPAVLQGKNLGQAKLADDYVDDGQRNAVTTGWEVNLYVKEHATKAASKIAAIQQAATLNAAVGVAVDQYARDKLRITDKNAKWTPKKTDLNNQDAPTIDPFMFGVMVSFAGADQDERLELIFQHAKEWTGYVEAIYDSTNTHTRAVPSMYDSRAEATRKGGKAQGDEHYRFLKFSNVHEKHDGNSRAPAPNILDLTTGGDEHNLDAYTKLAGEGARWQCVRKHASMLRDDSLFYTADPNSDTKVLAIDFKTLWITWAETFDKDYDITDKTVADKLQGSKVFRKINRRVMPVPPKTPLKTSLTAKDYNLDTGKSHGT